MPPATTNVEGCTFYPSNPEAAVVLEAGKQLGKPNHVPGYRPYAIIDDKIVYLAHEEPAPLPDFIKQRVAFRDVKALIAYVNRFKDSGTQIFADERAGTVTAILDYHLEAEAGSEPNNCAHVAVFTAEPSPEWKEWKGLDGRPQQQEKFAEFIENQAPFIVRPDAATMLEIASSFQAASSASFSKAIRLDNGQVQLQYVENINGQAGPKGALAVPKDFDVMLRPYVGCSPTVVQARFRYRIEGGRLSLWYDLFRADDILRETFDVILARVNDEVGIAPYIGAAAIGG